MKKMSRLIPLLAAFALLAAGKCQAQTDFAISDLGVTPQLTQMSGGDFAMTDTKAGEPEIIAEGGGYRVEAAVDLVPPTVILDDAELFITISGSNVSLTWISEGGDYILESTSALGDLAIWQSVSPAPTESRYIAPLQGTTQFFRLRRR